LICYILQGIKKLVGILDHFDTCSIRIGVKFSVLSEFLYLNYNDNSSNISHNLIAFMFLSL